MAGSACLAFQMGFDGVARAEGPADELALDGPGPDAPRARDAAMPAARLDTSSSSSMVNRSSSGPAEGLRAGLAEGETMDVRVGRRAVLADDGGARSTGDIFGERTRGWTGRACLIEGWGMSWRDSQALCSAMRAATRTFDLETGRRISCWATTNDESSVSRSVGIESR